MTKRLVTSESVTEGHPDKICDQIADAILDAILSKEQWMLENGIKDPDTGEDANPTDVRVAIETTVTTGAVIVSGEVRTHAYIDVQKIVRDTIRRIGYTRAKYGFDADTCGVISLIQGQSTDIAQGVDGTEYRDDESDSADKLGAGDQGIMYGYATDETPSRIPMTLYIAHKLAYRLSQVRKDGILSYLRPDGKTQATVEYEDDKPVRIDTVLVSTQHAPDTDIDTIRRDIYEHVIKPVLNNVGLPYDNVKILVNPTGRFVTGGPHGDTGTVGRKLVVDSYGGIGRIGGGAYSGKDPSKVDRSASYMARLVAKTIVDAGLAKRCEMQLSYAIGVPEPVSMYVDTYGTAMNDVTDELLTEAVSKTFDFRPGAIIRGLKLLKPIYEKTASYGHYGREDVLFSWEDTSSAVPQLLAEVEELKKCQ